MFCDESLYLCIILLVYYLHSNYAAQLSTMLLSSRWHCFICCSMHHRDYRITLYIVCKYNCFQSRAVLRESEIVFILDKNIVCKYTVISTVESHVVCK